MRWIVNDPDSAPACFSEEGFVGGAVEEFGEVVGGGEGVGAAIAVDGVDLSAAGEGVVALAALEEVESAASVEDVIAVVALEGVVPAAAANGVVGCAGGDEGAAEDRRIEGDRVVSAAGGDLHAAGRREGNRVTGPVDEDNVVIPGDGDRKGVGTSGAGDDEGVLAGGGDGAEGSGGGWRGVGDLVGVGKTIVKAVVVEIPDEDGVDTGIVRGGGEGSIGLLEEKPVAVRLVVAGKDVDVPVAIEITCGKAVDMALDAGRWVMGPKPPVGSATVRGEVVSGEGIGLEGGIEQMGWRCAVWGESRRQTPPGSMEAGKSKVPSPLLTRIWTRSASATARSVRLSLL